MKTITSMRLLMQQLPRASAAFLACASVRLYLFSSFSFFASAWSDTAASCFQVKAVSEIETYPSQSWYEKRIFCAI